MQTRISVFLVIIAIGFFSLSDSAQVVQIPPKAEITTTPPEIGEVKKDIPTYVLNFNLNIGNNSISSIGQTNTSKKSKIKTSSIHILKLQRKGDFFRILTEDEDGANEWIKVEINGLKYKGNGDIAWYYQEFDIVQGGKIIAKERLLTIHRNFLDSVLNSQDGASLP